MRGALPTVAGPVPKGAVSLPWTLQKVDYTDNRVYLSSAKQGCIAPSRVAITETDQEVEIAVFGIKSDGFCTSDKLTVVGYVSPAVAIGTRRIVHG